MPSPPNKKNFGNNGQKQCIICKVFCLCPILLGFFTLFHIFCLQLPVQTNLCLELVSVSCKLQYFVIFYNCKAFVKSLIIIESRFFAKKLQIEQFSVGTIFHVWFKSKSVIRKLLVLVSCVFLIELFSTKNIAD